MQDVTLILGAIERGEAEDKPRADLVKLHYFGTYARAWLHHEIGRDKS